MPRQFPISTVTLAIALLFTSTGQSSARAEDDKKQPALRFGHAELTLAGAERALAAGRRHARQMGISVNIAVVDDGGHLLAFARMDDARPSSVYTAMTKATSAALHRVATGPLGTGTSSATQLNLAIEHAALASGGKFTSLKGGVPMMHNGHVIGAVGVGGATGEQDAEVASAAVEAVTNEMNSVAADQNSRDGD